MPVSREDALNASLGLTEGAQLVAQGIPALIAENPDLDPEVKETLEMVQMLLPMLCGVFITSFERALEAEDALERVTEMIKTITVED